jgi:hypothetical protein
MIINRIWQDDIMMKINNGQPIDNTTGFGKANTWLIEVLSRRNIPFKVYNMGASVKRITTVTDVCPCCKKRI